MLIPHEFWPGTRTSVLVSSTLPGLGWSSGAGQRRRGAAGGGCVVGGGARRDLLSAARFMSSPSVPYGPPRTSGLNWRGFGESACQPLSPRPGPGWCGTRCLCPCSQPISHTARHGPHKSSLCPGTPLLPVTHRTSAALPEKHSLPFSLTWISSNMDDGRCVHAVTHWCRWIIIFYNSLIIKTFVLHKR